MQFLTNTGFNAVKWDMKASLSSTQYRDIWGAALFQFDEIHLKYQENQGWQILAAWSWVNQYSDGDYRCWLCVILFVIGARLHLSYSWSLVLCTLLGRMYNDRVMKSSSKHCCKKTSVGANKAKDNCWQHSRHVSICLNSQQSQNRVLKFWLFFEKEMNWSENKSYIYKIIDFTRDILSWSAFGFTFFFDWAFTLTERLNVAFAGASRATLIDYRI